jgi:thiol-disulfide isomerase/thioredoxin
MMRELQKELTRVFLPKRKGVPECMKVLSYAVVCIVVYAVYDIFFKGRGFEGYSNPNAQFTFFSMSGCGHCKKLAPTWSSFTKNNKSGIKTKMIDSGSPEFAKLAKKHNISGFPTLLLLDGSGEKIAAYDGDRSEKSLHEFCDKHK